MWVQRQVIQPDGLQQRGIGKDALFKSTIGSGNTATGDSALYNNHDQTDFDYYLNTAVGYMAGFKNTTGDEGSFFEAGAGSANTSCRNNTFTKQ
ncbi:MAG: hypothetical protein ABJB86_23290 [Bacteroidota bacterium]